MISNTNVLIIGWSITAILYVIKKMGIDIPTLVIGAFGVFGLLYVFINVVFFRKVVSDKNDVIDPKKAIMQSLLDDTYSLYNETGLFIKYCYTDDIKISGGRSTDLHKKFEEYLKVFKGKTLQLPQKLGLKMSHFFDVLCEYKRSGEVIVSVTKTPDRYTDQQRLEQKFTSEVSTLYSELEVELRKLLGKKTT